MVYTGADYDVEKLSVQDARQNYILLGDVRAGVRSAHDGPAPPACRKRFKAQRVSTARDFWKLLALSFPESVQCQTITSVICSANCSAPLSLHPSVLY